MSGDKAQPNQDQTDAVNYIELKADFVNFEDEEVECSFHFRKPTSMEMSRASKEAQKNADRAFKNLTITLVKPEDKEAYKDTVKQYPGVATSIATDIYQRMGYGSLGK